MSKRLVFVRLTMLAVALLSAPGSHAQSIPARSTSVTVPISIYRDDPFASASVVEFMDSAKFGSAEDGRPSLKSDLVWIEDDPVIYKLDFKTFQLEAFSWNPWPAPAANAYGDFRYPDEARFPLFKAERGPDGKIIIREGLQLWTPQDWRVGMNTAFAAAHTAKAAAESWAGRDIAWGRDGLLKIFPHFFIDFQAYHSHSANSLFFGIVAYRLQGETDVKFFETASSWEIVAHESGHALQFKLKPNADDTDRGFNAWAESVGDQTGMWASLRDTERVRQLLDETHGDLNHPNALTSLVEAFAALVGEGTGMREAFNDKKISDTSEEAHDRSEVFTGAAYKIFLKIYDELKPEFGPADAMRQAGQIMGVFLARANDYTPENQMTLEDVAKAYLKVDKEFFGGHYRAAMVDEFTRREIFDTESLSEWMAHEAAIPQLNLPSQLGDDDLERMLQANLDKLSIWPGFGVKLQSVTRASEPQAQSQAKSRWHFGWQVRDRVSPSREPAQTIVRVQLTHGRGADATLLNNHGILVFHADGRLSEYHSPLPPDDSAALLPDVFAQARMINWMTAMIGQANKLGINEHGVPLSIVRKADGQWTVEARVPHGEGPGAYMEVFTPENPQGERREIIIPTAPPDKRIPNAIDLLK